MTEVRQRMQRSETYFLLSMSLLYFEVPLIVIRVAPPLDASYEKPLGTRNCVLAEGTHRSLLDAMPYVIYF